MNSTTGSEYTENTYIHLKLIFAFAAQSSLTKVRNNNVRNAVCTRGAPRRARQHPCHIHKPVLGTRYSGTVPCRKTCTNHDITVYYVQLRIDDALSALLTLGAHAQRGLQYLVCHSFRPSVRLFGTTYSATAQQGSQKATPTGSVPHWLNF